MADTFYTEGTFAVTMGRLTALGIIALLASTSAAPAPQGYEYQQPDLSSGAPEALSSLGPQPGAQPPCDPCAIPPPESLPLYQQEPSNPVPTLCGDGPVKALIARNPLEERLKYLGFRSLKVPGGTLLVRANPDIAIQPPPILVRPPYAAKAVQPPPLVIQPPCPPPVSVPPLLVRPAPLQPIQPPPLYVKPPLPPPVNPPPVYVRPPLPPPVQPPPICVRPPTPAPIQLPPILVKPPTPANLQPPSVCIPFASLNGPQPPLPCGPPQIPPSDCNQTKIC